MTKRSLIIFAVCNTLIVALLASYLTTQLHNDLAHHHAKHTHETDFHSWVHAQLDLTAEQYAALHQAELEYEEQSVRLRENIDQASRKLALAVKSENPDLADIEKTLSEINADQGALRSLMIEHFFAMKEHLDPEQAEKVRVWIHDSLTSNRPSGR